MAINRPWDRQEGETSQAFEAFATYRDMGSSRTQRALSERLGRTIASLSRWAKQWRWKARIVAFETHEDQQMRKVLLDGRTKMRARHVALASRIQRKLMERISDLDADQISIADLARLYEASVRIERQAREDQELAHDLAQGINDMPLGFLSNEELENMEQMLADARERQNRALPATEMDEHHVAEEVMS